jgi:hypothetical protein
MAYQSKLLLFVRLVATDEPHWGLSVLGEIDDLIKGASREKFDFSGFSS